MRLRSQVALTAFTLSAVACSASSQPPTGGGVVEIAQTPATMESSLPAASATPSAVPTASPGPQAKGPIDAAAACFLCRNEGNNCVRPDASARMASLTCGDGFNLSRSKISGAPIDCNPGCCRPATSKGADRDADGLGDADDQCPDEPEDVDGFQDADGCPDTDNDHDGVADVEDRCCYVAEDADGEKDLDGCPE